MEDFFGDLLFEYELIKNSKEKQNEIQRIQNRMVILQQEINAANIFNPTIYSFYKENNSVDTEPYILIYKTPPITEFGIQLELYGTNPKFRKEVFGNVI